LCWQDAFRRFGVFYLGTYLSEESGAIFLLDTLAIENVNMSLDVNERLA